MLDKNDCITIDCVEVQGKTYFFKPELELFLQVENHNSRRLPLLIIDQPRLELLVFAHTKEKLLYEAIEQIKFLIEEYVLADDKNFSPGAKQLRKTWLKIITN